MEIQYSQLKINHLSDTPSTKAAGGRDLQWCVYSRTSRYNSRSGGLWAQLVPLLSILTTLCLPPALFRRSRTMSAHWRSTSSNPPRTLSAYWQSTPAPIALFVKVSLGRACNDYNLTFLCWCEMTNLSATFFISQTFALTLTDNTFVILITPCCDSWDVQGQSLSGGSKAFSCTTLLPGLGACNCLATL